MGRRVCKACTLPPNRRFELDQRLLMGDKPADILAWLQTLGYSDITSAILRYHRSEHIEAAKVPKADLDTDDGQVIDPAASSWAMQSQLRTVIVTQINRLHKACAKAAYPGFRIEAALTAAEKLLAEELKDVSFERSYAPASTDEG